MLSAIAQGMSSLTRGHSCLNLAALLDCVRQVLITLRSDKHIVLDTAFCQLTAVCASIRPGDLPNAANIPVLVQYGLVDVFAVLGIFQEGNDDEVAEINLSRSANSYNCAGQQIRTPGSTVTTLPAGSFPRNRRYLK